MAIGPRYDAGTFKSFDVWKRLGKQRAVRYRCFEILPGHKYCVQSADFYDLPLDENKVRNLEKQFIELFMEELPSRRSRFFDSVEEAILSHKREFMA